MLVAQLVRASTSGPCRSERCRIEPYLYVFFFSLLDLVMFEFVPLFYTFTLRIGHWPMKTKEQGKEKYQPFQYYLETNNSVSKLVAESVIASTLGLCHEKAAKPCYYFYKFM